MNQRSVRLYLQDMIESIELIQQYVASTTLTAFLEDPQLQDSVLRRFIVLGEAANQVPDDVREQYAHLPWSEIRGMRNFLIHEYPGIDLPSTWRTIHEDLPPLKRQLQAALETLEY